MEMQMIFYIQNNPEIEWQSQKTYTTWLQDLL